MDTIASDIAIEMCLLLVFVFVLVLALRTIYSKTKSERYRKFIANMYVASKIRFFADEDNLDLVAEEEAFKNYIKKQNSTVRDLDDSIEEELKERVGNCNEKQKETKKK